MKADLHVHSYHSGYASHLRFLRTRDCYSDPEDVYRVAKMRGMDLVCLTDHDSIDGCLEFLGRHPDSADFIMGEEIECTFPRLSGGRDRDELKVHLGVLGITERVHREIQPLRKNIYEAAAYLTQQSMFFAVNHLFFFYRGQMRLARYLEDLLERCPAVEVRNGSMLRQHNVLIEEVVAAWTRRSGAAPLACVGGSDAHTLGRIAAAYTAVPASTREEYLSNLKAGLGRASGGHGTAASVGGEIYGVILRYWAGLLGIERHDLRWPERARAVACSVASLPFQFIPGAVAAIQKRDEAARVRSCAAGWRQALSAAGEMQTPARSIGLDPDPCGEARGWGRRTTAASSQRAYE